MQEKGKREYVRTSKTAEGSVTKRRRERVFSHTLTESKHENGEKALDRQKLPFLEFSGTYRVLPTASFSDRVGVIARSRDKKSARISQKTESFVQIEPIKEIQARAEWMGQVTYAYGCVISKGWKPRTVCKIYKLFDLHASNGLEDRKAKSKRGYNLLRLRMMRRMNLENCLNA